MSTSASYSAPDNGNNESTDLLPQHLEIYDFGTNLAPFGATGLRIGTSGFQPNTAESSTTYALQSPHISQSVLDISSILAISSPYNLTRFATLPPAIRRKIWHETLPSSRKVMIDPICPPILRYDYRLSKFFDESLKWNPVPDTDEMVPIALHVNRESRAEALLHLKVFGCERENNTAYYEGVPGKYFKPLRSMYINYDRDWICIESLEYLGSHFVEQQKRCVQLVVVDERDTDNSLWGYIITAETLQPFEALRKVYIVGDMMSELNGVLMVKEKGNTAALDLIKYPFSRAEDGDDRFQAATRGIKRLREAWVEAWGKRVGGKGKFDLRIGGAELMRKGMVQEGRHIIGHVDGTKEEEEDTDEVGSE